MPAILAGIHGQKDELMKRISHASKTTRGKAISQHCFDCLYDPLAAGTNRQQVTLCSVYSCALRPYRPVTKSPIPESVLNYYGITGPERARYASPGASFGGLVEQTPTSNTVARGTA